NIPTYCARKHGDEEPEYLHPILEPILKETFGVIIYQEQVMQIAQVMAGYSLGDADLLRRAMGKKIRAEMEKQRAVFVAGAVKNGVPKGQADTIFELLAKFADYGFNKSHAAAYARVFGGAEAILAACQRSHEASTLGQNDMFGGAADAPTIMLPQIEPWLPAERLRREYDAIGFFLSGHPLDDYAAILKRLRVQSWAEFSRAVKTGATAGKVAATVVSRMERRTKTGNKMGIMGLSDPTGHFEAVLFSEGLAQYREVLEPGAAVLLQLGAELQGEDVRARVLHAEPLDDAAANTQ